MSFVVARNLSRRTVIVWALSLPLLGLVPACEQPTPIQEGMAQPTNSPASPATQRGVLTTPPSITANISDVKLNWKASERQQLFNFSLTNNGDKTETIHAIIYGRNEETKPPRRAISPPTAFEWFKLA